jgi:ParB family chromosome partitioning protein
MSKEAFSAKKRSIFMFDPDDLILVTDKSHPLYDERVNLEPNESLVKNILFEGQGVLEPIIVTKEADKPVVVDGRQRTKAARVASSRIKDMGGKGLLVPCIYRRGTDSNLVVMMASANHQRTEEAPTEKARKMNALLNFGHSEEEIAGVFNCSKQTVKNTLAILSLDPVTQKKLDAGEVTKTDAVKASRLPRKERRSQVAQRPRMRKRKEIEVKLAESQENGHKTFQRALAWVLKEIDELEVE